MTTKQITNLKPGQLVKMVVNLSVAKCGTIGLVLEKSQYGDHTKILFGDKVVDVYNCWLSVEI